MNDYVTLVGAEAVERAAREMSSAADAMQRAAGEFEASLYRQRSFMEDWLARFESAIKDARGR